MQRRQWFSRLIAVLAVASTPLLPSLALAADEAPDALVQRISGEVMTAVKADAAIQKGDVNRIMALVDSKIMPNVNFSRMTASAVGRFWRQATPAQQKQLQDEFKTLLVRTYSGALGEVKDQTVSFARCAPSPKTPRWWCAPKCAAVANRSSWTTAWKRHPRAGRFTT